MHSRILARRGAVVALTLTLGFGSPVLVAETITLGSSGWQASFDSSLDPFVDINFVDQVGDSLLIQKSAEFTQGPDGFGTFPTIPIVFSQVGPSTVDEIVILDEIITNNTGADWTGFRFELLDGDDVAFDDGPGFFFSTTPFDNQSFTPDLQGFFVDGFGLGPGGSDALVVDGTQWFPGDGASDGNLVMQVVSTGATVFTLKETPIPEPATLVLLGFGSLVVLNRRR